MKFLLILAVIATIYVLVIRKPAPPLSAVPAGPTPMSEVSAALKRPLDKTHAALEAVKKRNGDGEF